MCSIAAMQANKKGSPWLPNDVLAWELWLILAQMGLTLWRMQCTSCKAVFTVLPHFVLRYRRMSPDVAQQALIATHGGLSLEWCATICHISPMALYRLICALGQHSLVTVLVKCRLPLPTYILVDEKHSHCL